jgi:hypothetical protein
MKLTDDEILSKARERYKAGRTHAAAWRKEAHRCFDFRAGNQWTEEDKATLVEQLRMPTTFNRIDPYCRAVSGLEAGNRQQIRYIPREQGDVAVNELLTETGSWVREEADAEFEEADSFIDAFISGIGATETYMDYDTDPEGMVKIDHLDCLNEVVWDPTAKKRNLTDRKFDFRIKRELDVDEVKGMFPDSDKVDQIVPCPNDWEGDDEDILPWDRNPETAYKHGDGKSDGGSEKKNCTLLDYQWCEREPYYKIADPISGEIVEMEAEKYTKLSANLKKMGVELQAAKLHRVVWYRAFIVGKVVIEVGPAPCKTSSTRKFITAYRDRNRKMWYGLVRAMIDPQEWSNKFFSQILHIINQNSKGGLMAEADAFVNPRKAEEDWANPSSVILLKQGGLAKVQEREPAQFPAAIDRMMQFSIQAMGDVTGLPLEVIGMVDRQQAGVLEAERKKTGITMLATLFDSFRHYHKDQGRLLLYFIQEYLSDGRLVRITGPEGMKYVPLMKQPDTAKFDVIVDEMPQSPNNKERVWGTMQVMLPILQQAGLPPELLAEIVAYSPLPASFVQKLKQAMAERKGAPPDPMMQAQVAKLQADVREKNASAGLDEAKTATEVFSTGMDAMQANAIAEQMMQGPGAAPGAPGMPPGAPSAPPPQQMQPQMPAQGMQ